MLDFDPGPEIYSIGEKETAFSHSVITVTVIKLTFSNILILKMQLQPQASEAK